MEQAINLKVQKQLILGQGKLLQLLFFQIVYMAKSRKSQIQEAKMSFLRRVSGLSLGDRVRSSDTQERLRVELLLLRVERMSPWGGVLGMSIGEETPGQTEGMLERLYLSAGL